MPLNVNQHTTLALAERRGQLSEDEGTAQSKASESHNINLLMRCFGKALEKP